MNGHEQEIPGGVMRNGTKVFAASLILTAAFLALSILGRFIPSQRFLFTCFFLYIVMVPGCLAALRFAPWTRGALRLLASFVFGVTISFAVLFFTALFGLDVRIVAVIIPAVVVALAISVALGKRTPSPPTVENEDIPGESRFHQALLLVLVIAVSLLIMRGGDPLLYTSDSADHIAYIRTIARTHETFPEQFYYRDGGILTHDIRKGMGHAMWGALEALTGSHDAAAVWPVMSLISSAFTMVAVFCAGLALFGSATIGLLAAVLLVLFYGGGLREYQLTMSASGGLFGRVFYLAAFSLVPLVLERPRRGYVPLLGAAAFAATCAHFTYFALLLFVAGIFTLVYAARKRGTGGGAVLRNGILLCAVLILVNVPYLALRYVRDYAPNNPIHTVVQGVLFLTHRLYILNPLEFFDAAGPLGMLAVVAVFVLWRKRRGEARLALCLYRLICVYVLVFNPIWVPFLLRKLSYLLLRFEFAIPSVLVCAYLLVQLWAKLGRRNPDLSPFGAAIALVAAAALLGPPLAQTSSRFAYGARAMRRAATASYQNLDDLFSFIDRECPPGSVVVSDPVTSFGIPAFTDEYAACPFDQHATPNDSTAIARITDCRKIFDPGASLAEIHAVLVKYGAEYLVINGRIPPSVETLYWKPYPAAAAALAARLREPTSPLRIIFEREGVTMAKLVVCPSCKAVEGSSARPAYWGDSLDAPTAHRLPTAGIPEIRIAEVRSARARAARGDTVTLEVTWLAAKKCPFASYVAYARFDTDFPKGALYRPAWGKPYRKIVERVAGHRFRFRVDFQPLGGIVPPDVWPVMREIRDRVNVPIPRDAAPGTYTISLKIAEKPQYPNYELKDILTDDDVYSGMHVGTIGIE